MDIGPIIKKSGQSYEMMFCCADPFHPFLFSPIQYAARKRVPPPRLLLSSPNPRALYPQRIELSFDILDTP